MTGRNYKNIYGKGSKATLLLVAVLACALVVTTTAALISAGRKEAENPAGNTDSVIITELMPSNLTVLKDEKGAYSDWIELRNTGSSPVVMTGYYLSDDAADPFMWAFPDVTLGGGEYMVVFCSGADEYDSQAGSYHTNFRLSGDGETVVLTNSVSGQTNTVTYGGALADVSYGLIRTEESDGFTYKWLDTPTPGRANEGSYADSAYRLPSTEIQGVVINEYMTSNTYTLYDSEGDYCDWVELYNGASSAIDLYGCCLTDDETDTAKWMFPEGCVIGAGEYLTVFLSGKGKAVSGTDVIAGGELHTSFRIGAKDSAIVLYDKSARMVDRVDIVPLADDVSYGRGADGNMLYFSYATPGRANGEGFAELPVKTTLSGQVYISEVCAASNRMRTSANNTDWIELYNGSSQAVSLSGYALGKSPEELRSYIFPDITLQPGEYTVVYAMGDNASRAEHASFRVDSSGDTLYLSDADGRVIDVFSSGKLRIGVTSGRASDGSSERRFFSAPTKGTANSGVGASGYAPVPVILTEGGYCKAGTRVEISVPEGTQVRYTLDGSSPTEESPLYDGAIEINESLTLKAAAFGDGLLPSDCVFTTFLVEEEHTLPVMCISSDNDGLFGATNGIYNVNSSIYGSFDAILNETWERAADYEYYVDGKRVLAFSAGVRLFGSGSRYYNQRSLAIMLRDCYGRGSITYPFFKDSDHVTAKALVLRAGGQDQGYTFLRDGYCARVALQSTDRFLATSSQPVVVYINGRYWGLYELREKINEDFLELNYGIDKSKVDIILNNGIVSAGSYDEFYALNEYLRSHLINDEETWEYIQENIDVGSAVDYLIYESFFKNIDYGNVRLYKDTNDGKWKWIFFDLDMTMREGSTYPNVSALNNIFTHDMVTAKLVQNEHFKTMLLERYAELLPTVFDSEALLATLNDMAAEIEPEIERNAERWEVLPYKKWQKEMDSLRERITYRRPALLEELRRYFNISDEDMQRLFGDILEPVAAEQQ